MLRYATFHTQSSSQSSEPKKKVSPCSVAITSHVDVLRGSSSVPVPLTSVDSSSKKRRTDQKGLERLACSGRSDSRTREKNSGRNKKKRGETRGGRGRERL